MKKLLLLLAGGVSALSAQTLCQSALMVQGQPVGITCPTDASTGVTGSDYVKWNTGGTGVTLGATTDIKQQFFGIADQTVAAAQPVVLIHTSGPIYANFDGATTAGHSFTTSGTVNGQLHDTGVAFSTSTCGIGSIGIINQTIGSTGLAAATIKPCVGAGTVASGATALGTSSIASGACATVVTVSATGVLTTDSIVYTPAADPTGVTGYAVSATGSLYIWTYPTADNVNFKVCNNTSGALVPSALTINWRVLR